jgi:hypothetical protein
MISRILGSRRRVLRGILGGTAVSVGLPFLDCALNTNGTALASGAPIPPRFASWFWALGLGEADYRPKQAGIDYELPHQLESLAPFKKKMNLFSGGEVFLDGQSNNTHFTGVQGLITGKVSGGAEFFGSLDTLIGEQIGRGTRFRSIEVACDGDPRASWSARTESGRQPAEVSPLALYTRIFGPEFRDPNAATFTPDPNVMVRRSVLSGVNEDRQALMRDLGSTDRARLDNYFTSLRALEQKLDIELQKPAPLPSCTKPGEPAPDETQALNVALKAMERHNQLAQLLTHALACGQTRVVNLCITQGMSGLRRDGDPTNHHTYTHEEPVDATLGYQVKSSWFQALYMKGLHDFAAMLDGIQEGDSTMLDRMILYAFTDHSAPRLHSLRNYPQITLGTAGGRIKTGMHIPRPGDAATRVGLTLQQAMGVPVDAWGAGSNRVTSPIPGILA